MTQEPQESSQLASLARRPKNKKKPLPHLSTPARVTEGRGGDAAKPRLVCPSSGRGGAIMPPIDRPIVTDSSSEDEDAGIIPTVMLVACSI